MCHAWRDVAGGCLSVEVCCGKGWMCWQDEAEVTVYVRIKSKDSRAFFVFPVSGEGAVIQTNAKCISTCIRAVRPHSAVEFKELAHLTGFSSLQVMLISPYVHICQMHPKLSGILNDFFLCSILCFLNSTPNNTVLLRWRHKMVIFKKLKYQESFMRPNYLLFLFAFKKQWTSNYWHICMNALRNDCTLKMPVFKSIHSLLLHCRK